MHALMAEEEEGHHGFDPAPLLWLSLWLSLGAICRQLLTRWIEVPVPYHTILFLLGMLVGGIFRVTNEHDDSVWTNPLSIKNDAFTVYGIYVPICVLDALFNSQIAYFKYAKKCALLIVGPIYVCSITLISLGGFYVFDLSLTQKDWVLLAAILLLPGLQVTRDFLMSHNSPPDHLHVFDTEACVTLISYVVYVFAKREENQLDKNIIAVVLSVLLGIFVARLTIHWSHKTSKDSVNTTTIIVTCMYLTFAASHMIYGLVGSYMAIWSLSLTMCAEKDIMPSASVVVFNKLAQIMLLMLNCAIAFIAGLLFSKTMDHLNLIEIVAATTIFILLFAIRCSFLFGLHPSYKDKYLSRRSSVLIVANSRLRGPFTLMFGIILYDCCSGDRSYTLFNQVILQTLLSDFIHSAIGSIIFYFKNKYGDITEYGKKAIMLERAARFIIESKVTRMITLKSKNFTADSDWERVVQYTKLKVDFLRVYRNKQWLKNPSKLAKIRETKIASDGLTVKKNVRDEASHQLVNAQREVFRQLYELGTLSKSSYQKLRIIAAQALKHQSLIKATDVIKRTEVNPIYEKLESSLKESFKKTTWTNYLFLRLFIYCTMCSIDALMTMLALKVMYIPDEVIHNDVLKFYNFAVIGVLFVILIVEYMVYGRKLKGPHFQSCLVLSILVIGVIDVAVVYYLGPYLTTLTGGTLRKLKTGWQWSTYERGFVASRFLRQLLQLGILQILQEKFLYWVSLHVEKKVLSACDMTMGFLTATKHAERKIPHIVQLSAAGQHLQYICQMSRHIMRQHLGIIELEKLGVLTSLKTKIATRNVLRDILAKINEIRDSGLIPSSDAAVLQETMELQGLLAKGLQPSFPPANVTQIISNLSWVDGDQDLTFFLMKHGRILIYSPHDVIVSQGQMPRGIFIILFGLVRVEQEVISGCLQYGGQKVQQVMYYTAPQEDGNVEPDNNKRKHTGTEAVLLSFIGRGVVIGEKALLTGRPGHKSFVCATHTEVLFVEYQDMILKVGRADFDSNMSRLETRLWKSVAVTHSVGIMLREINSHGLFYGKLMQRMSSAYIIDGNVRKMIVIDHNSMAAVCLISGFTKNFYTGAKYAGPCIIPDHVEKLVCLPEAGPRVILLVVKSGVGVEQQHYEQIPHEEINIDDSLLTVSSGSTICGPHRKKKAHYKKCPDQSVRLPRPAASKVFSILAKQVSRPPNNTDSKQFSKGPAPKAKS